MSAVLDVLDLALVKTYRLKAAVWLMGGATLAEDIASGKDPRRLPAGSVFTTIGVRVTRKPTFWEWILFKGRQPLCAPLYRVEAEDPTSAPRYDKGWIDSIALVGERGVALVELVT